MLKKLLAMMLLVCITISFCSCGFILKDVIPDIIEDIGVIKDIETTELTEDISDAEETEDATAKSESYKDIICVESDSFRRFIFSVKNDNTVFGTSMPRDISFANNGDGYLELIRNGEKIGFMQTESNTALDEDNAEFSEDHFNNGVTLVHSIHRIADGEYVHYYEFKYSNENNVLRKICLTVDYRELDQFASNKIVYNISTDLASTEVDMTSNKLSSNVIDRGANILIIGNSFINSSDIGNILSDMCRDKHYVDAISIGYATVSKTYSVDEGILNRIKSGDVDALFICGFYSLSDATALSSIVYACEVSNTKLFVFPAHNENLSAIESAVSKYDYPVFLDWKGEIDALIDNGVDYDEFCVQDTHKHSKPLAGYVGAHMIYRTLFGEFPPDTNFSIDQKYVDEMLGDYVNTGTVDLIDEANIIRFE